MKARIKQNPADGKWWCFRMGVAGCGNTPEEAWRDMWQLYKEAVRRPQQQFYSTGKA